MVQAVTFAYLIDWWVSFASLLCSANDKDEANFIRIYRLQSKRSCSCINRWNKLSEIVVIKNTRSSAVVQAAQYFPSSRPTSHLRCGQLEVRLAQHNQSRDTSHPLPHADPELKNSWENKKFSCRTGRAMLRVTERLAKAVVTSKIRLRYEEATISLLVSLKAIWNNTWVGHV